MRQVDLLVMGAGPAGAAAARAAAGRGLSVLVIDKARFPRDKLCGGLLSGRTAMQLERVFGAAPEGAMFRPTREVLFSWKGRPFSEGTCEDPMHLTMRWSFDAWLVDLARAAGAEVLEAERAADPGLGGGVARLSDGQEVAWRALIGADGVNSAVARTLFGESFDRSRIGFCLETEVPHELSLRQGQTSLQIDFGGVPWGYAWSFPKEHGVTLGLGAVEARAGDFKVRMAALMRQHLRDPGAVKVKGHFIPAGDFRAVPGRGRVLLAGDAAGLVDPLTGEGIAYAIESGAMAAHAVADWLAEGAPGDPLPRYQAALERMHASITASGHLAANLHRKLVPAALKRRLIAEPSVQRRFFAILNGRAEASDLADFSIRDYVARRLGVAA